MAAAPERPIRGYVIPGRPSPEGPNDAPIVIYGYVPSLVLSVIAAATFGLATVAHLLQAIRYRTWYMLLMVVGACFEVVGFAFRGKSNTTPYDVRWFIVQYFFIVVAPVFFAAAIYVILSKFIQKAGRMYAALPPKLIVALFVIIDIVSIAVQIAGAALIGAAESNRKDSTTPNNILLAGLAVQVFAFGIFLLLLCITIWRSKRYQSAANPWPRSKQAQLMLLAVLVASLLVELRTIFRLIETAQGVYGYLSSREPYFGCLEYLPVILAVTILAVVHPGAYIPKETKPAGTLSNVHA